MVHALQFSLTFYLTAYFVSFSFLPTVFCTDEDLPAGDTRVDVTDARIQYDPPMNDTEVWTTFNSSHLNTSGISTSNNDATLSFTFQGIQISLLAIAYPKFPGLLVTLDSKQFTLSDFHVDYNGGSGNGSMGKGASDKEGLDKGVKAAVTLPQDGSILDGSASHTLTFHKAPDTDDNDSWNLLALSFRPPPSTSSSTFKSMLSSATIGLSPSPSETNESKSSEKLSGGATAGVVIGVLLSVVLAGFIFIFVCRRRRRREMVDVSPDPLMIPTGTNPRPNRSRFRRLPHFTAPSSIWPPTETPVSTTLVPRQLPIARESLHERITPFELPTLAPQIRISAPPKQRKTRRPRYSSFFVANPSNHSSNSARSHSLSDQHVRPDRIPARGSKVDLLEIDVEEKEMEDQLGVMRVDKGKQKAINFGAGAPSPPRQRMTRKQSIRRFFTTNPSPSTASSSSTSSKKTANSKRAAVTDYVRNQMRQKPPAGSHLDSIPLPPPVPAHRPLPSIVIPEEAKPGLRQAPMQQILRSQPAPAGKRQSQTLLFAANPDPSTHNLPSDHADTSSSISEIPPPRKDKGKARAF